ncbi:hypothetical protein KEM52_004568 [Ascosphaera acerosa]|nr:hypothetical protein KEM52_004568 [Ascosphaera acerosa]
MNLMAPTATDRLLAELTSQSSALSIIDDDQVPGEEVWHDLDDVQELPEIAQAAGAAGPRPAARGSSGSGSCARQQRKPLRIRRRASSKGLIARMLAQHEQSRRYTTTQDKLRATLKLWDMCNFNLRKFLVAFVGADDAEDRQHRRNRAGVLHEALQNEAVSTALAQYESKPIDNDAAMRRATESRNTELLREEMRALVGQPFFNAWSPEQDIRGLKPSHTFGVLQATCPRWLQLLSFLSMNDRSTRTVEESFKKLEMQRHCVSVTAMVSHYRTRNRSNFLKKLVGLNLYLSGVSRRCLDVIAQWGCCDSYITLHRDTQLIAQHASRRRMALARDPQTLIAYDNFQFNAHF